MGFKFLKFSLVLLVVMTSIGYSTEPSNTENQSTKSLVGDTGIIFGYMGVSMALLRQLPEDTTQWRHSDPEDLSWQDRYLKNIQAGPVWDADLRFFNAYTHIHIGASYQVLCADHGYSDWHCFLYTNGMSLLWEYGPEAIKEIPSWQDILMTGPVGYRVGKVFYEWRNQIDRQSGEVFGSVVLGSIFKFLLDPAGHLVSGTRKAFGFSFYVNHHEMIASKVLQNQNRASLLKLNFRLTLGH